MFSDFKIMPEAYYAILLYSNNKKSELPLDPANISDFTIIWDYNDLCVEGYVIFNDTQKITELLPPHNGICFKVSLKDHFNIKFERVFKVTKIDRDFEGQSVATIKFELVDEYYNMFANTFISKGYNNVKSTDVIKDIFSTKSDLISTPLNIIIKDTPKNTYENYVIQGNKNLLYLLNNMQKFDDLLIINTRKGIVIMPTDNIGKLAPDLSKVVKFSPTQTQEYSPYSVKDFTLIQGDMLTQNAILPPSITYQVDSKRITKEEHNTKISHGKSGLKTSLTINDKDGIQGIKIFPYLHNIVDSIYNTEILESSAININVAGMFNHNLMCKVSFDANSSIETLKSKMPYVTGEYFITKIIDHISSGNVFTQTITLGRIGSV
ncbi:hypothetical protein F356_077 [Campylobacter phage F356]|uniref:Tail protein n=2 Tax=Fletchervirus CPX TaxID=1110702 RepID=A0A7T3KEG4_9CAUD|nr:hypothetical protein F355_119 [Campylobacter phage F355]QPX63715.1 hypothetical protein F356_077 [Campylobacter phage F356]